ncbi:hypothetical protein CLF_108357 [Clonorchis sinensis]|uniref:Uncharacterized protein n=1 Tax=Clonorchis sinensis TaxID=79923 RepID=G7YRJ9_CLOSI|nr:hypothetical protein CLF_108357 [Clonorchis sinensis]
MIMDGWDANAKQKILTALHVSDLLTSSHPTPLCSQELAAKCLTYWGMLIVLSKENKGLGNVTGQLSKAAIAEIIAEERNFPAEIARYFPMFEFVRINARNTTDLLMQ